MYLDCSQRRASRALCGVHSDLGAFCSHYLFTIDYFRTIETGFWSDGEMRLKVGNLRLLCPHLRWGTAPTTPPSGSAKKS